MAFLSGASPKKPNGAVNKCKEIVIEVYDGASFTLAKCDFKEATLALCLALQSAEVDRINVESDKTLKFLGGLVTNNEQNRASYAVALQDALPEGSVLKYLSPSMSDNLTAWTVTDGDEIHVCPAVWCVHMASHDPVNCLKTVRAFLENAILNDGGWKVVPNTKVLQRLATPPGRDSWTEYMRVSLKPRGTITEPCADALDKLLREFAFLTHDGSLAYTPASPFKTRTIMYKFATAEEAMEALKLRDAKVWNATNPTLAVLNEETSQQQGSIGVTVSVKEACPLQESNRKDDMRESKAFEELLSVKAAVKIEELSEEHKRLQNEIPTNKDRTTFYGKLVQSRKAIESFKQIVEKITLIFKEEGTFKDKVTLVLNSLEQVWAQLLTDKERDNVMPLLQLSFNVAKASFIEYDFNNTFSNVHLVHDEVLTDCFKEKAGITSAWKNGLDPDAFFNLVNPQWEKQKEALQAQETAFVEKEDYESASGKAVELLKLEANTPKNLQNMLQEQGPRDVILKSCDELVADIVRVNPPATEDLERAYKRMRHT